MNSSESSWHELFDAPGAHTTALRFRILRRHGEPFLVLPQNNRTAAAALDLYPAQSGKARTAKRLLSAALALGAPLPLRKISVQADPQAPFCRFLAQHAGTAALPTISILCGNPRTPGRRFILLLFADDGRPARIVKAGITDDARQLISRESGFLKSVSPGTSGVPKTFEDFDDGRIRAFAMEFIEGNTALPRDPPPVGKLVMAWINPSATVTAAETGPWLELDKACAGHPLLRQPVLRARQIHSVIWHGDLAPWNIRRDSRTGRIVALDWERGRLAGLPGWDWFHYVVQTAILGLKLRTHEVRARVEALFASEPFQDYAGRCGIRGAERELLLAYLLYNLDVIKPAEGRDEIQALLETF